MDLLSHHAYLIGASRGDTAVSDFLSAHGLSIPAEGETVVRSYQSMGIDDAREIFSMQLRATDTQSAAIYVLEASFITREAQNAMLKMLEEPTSRTHFVLVTPHPELLLPTLRSRLTLISEKILQDKGKEGISFRSLPYAERMSLIEPLIEEGNRSTAELLLRSCIAELDERALQSNPKLRKLTGQLDRLHGYITDSSSSVKLILEYAAFTVPSE